jgi:CubicO group peptidase (beta-lactamase class C family)
VKRRLNVRTLVVLALLSMPAGMLNAQQLPGEQAAVSEALDSAEVYLAGENIPGFAAGMLSCGENYFRSGGLIRVDRRLRINSESRFNLGSNAKSMLASVAGRFVERDIVRFDSTLGELWPTAAAIAPDKADITLEQLLAHRSGLAAFSSGADLEKVPEFSGFAPDVRRQSAMWFLEQPLESEPGSTTRYSNAGYVVAGVLLARASGRPLELMLKEQVFEPLGMDARVGPSESVEQPFGHYMEDGLLRVNLDLEPPIPTFLDAAGNVSVTAADYAAYIQAHLCGLQGIETGYLRPETVRRLHTPLGEGGGALGWGISDIGGTRTSFHVGGTGDFTAYVALAPLIDYAVLALMNVGGEPAAPGSTWLVETITAAAASAEQADPPGSAPATADDALE